MQVRPTRAEIDLEALAHNLGVLRAFAGEARVFGVVKADAYGHGLVPVAQTLVAAGADGLCVALAEEGLTLRAAGVEAPIIVLNGIYDGAHRDVVEAKLTPVVYDLGDIERFAALDRSVDVHVKIDTGMSRLGVRDVDAFLAGLDGTPSVRVAGLMTHLSSAESDEPATRAQLAAFDAASERFAAAGHAPRVRHAANSAATILHPTARLDLVRPGVALYGVRPTPNSELDLRAVMRVVTWVARVAEIPAGAAVGYGRTWTAERPSRIATLAIGYGDGYLRALSGRGEVVIRGQRCPLVGMISMDLAGVDVSALPECHRGDEAIILGPELRAEEVASWAGTIAYEVLAAIAPRVPRIHVAPESRA